jgi:hypothetical protein
MSKMKTINPTLHAQVKQVMSEMSQEAASAGVQQMRQQAQAGPAMM